MEETVDIGAPSSQAAQSDSAMSSR